MLADEGGINGAGEAGPSAARVELIRGDEASWLRQVPPPPREEAEQEGEVGRATTALHTTIPSEKAHSSPMGSLYLWSSISKHSKRRLSHEG